jgi:NAD(P)-dependent dehydrogenase (short-subunit alcohol dehydrogenase family)
VVHVVEKTRSNGSCKAGTRAFLPGMLEAGEGTTVNVPSEAGRQASVKSGVAYVASEFGLAGLTQSINVEERERTESVPVVSSWAMQQRRYLTVGPIRRLKRHGPECSSLKMSPTVFILHSPYLQGH